MEPCEVLEFVDNVGCYPCVSIAYQILLTTLVTVASAEINFSKLKLQKNYWRSSMSQERLNNLAILCIENNILESFDFENVIHDLHRVKLKKKPFLWSFYIILNDYWYLFQIQEDIYYGVNVFVGTKTARKARKKEWGAQWRTLLFVVVLVTFVGMKISKWVIV